MRRIGGQHPSNCATRFLVAPERRQRIAAVQTRAQEAGIDGRRALEIRQRLGRAVELEQHVATIVERLGIIGHERERLLDAASASAWR